MDFSVFCANFNEWGGGSHQRVDNKKGDRSMKLWQIVGGAAALTLTLAGCAQKSGNVPTPTAGSAAIAQTQIQGPAVTGSVNIRQRIALPPDAILTVTLSDASLADAPSKVIAQRAVRTDGKQAPFNFVLPFNPADIQPNARIILSAAITVNGQLIFITDTIQEVVNRNGTRADLLLVPVQGIPVQATPTAMP
jgi:putative lipoprotein